jgi:uracil DNA glycosylase
VLITQAGWERFTDAIIQTLNSEHSGLVFFLWGSYAQKKRVMKKYIPIQATGANGPNV